MDFHGFYVRIEKENEKENALLSFSRLVHWDRRIAQIQCEQIAMNKKITLIFCLLCQTIFRIFSLLRFYVKSFVLDSTDPSCLECERMKEYELQ